MIKARCGHALVFLNNFIYAIGGLSDGQNFTNSCEKFDTISLKWTNISSLNYKSNNPSACAFNNK